MMYDSQCESHLLFAQGVAPNMLWFGWHFSFVSNLEHTILMTKGAWWKLVLNGDNSAVSNPTSIDQICDVDQSVLHSHTIQLN